MPCYKDEKTGTWYCQFRYADFTGKRKQKRKRGFKTKREAQEWEREFHLQKAKSCDMTLASFVELYFNDREHHVRDTTIYKTYHRKKGQDIFGPTKNSKKGGNRNVPIPHWLAEEFRTYCSRLYGLTPDDRVFYMTCTALNKELTRCTQLTYLPDIRVHDLRHSHVSLCIELGYSVVLVARRIGDTVPVVMRTYAHLYPNKQQELVSKLEAIGSPSSNDDESDLMSLG